MYVTQENIFDNKKKNNLILTFLIIFLLSARNEINCYRITHSQAQSSGIILTSFWKKKEKEKLLATAR